MKTHRKEMMDGLKDLARRADERGDVVERKQRATAWRELATAAEARRAPAYLTWIGR